MIRQLLHPPTFIRLAPAARALIALVLALQFPLLAASQESEVETEPPDSGATDEETIDYTKLKSPVPYTQRSIDRGKIIYRRRCTECHGLDGKAMVDVIANATDLTNPELWRSGTTEGEIFHSIRDGAGVDMPPFSFDIRREEDLWHLVNFVRSLWPEDKRPELQKEAASEESDEDSAASAEDGGTDREEG